MLKEQGTSHFTFIPDLSRTSRGALAEGRKRKIFKFVRREYKLYFPFTLPQEPQESLLMTVKRRRYLTHTLFLTLIVSLCNAPDKIRAQHNFERDDHRATGPLTENALPIWELNILSQQRAKGDARQRFHSGLARFFASPSYSHARSLAAGFACHSK